MCDETTDHDGAGAMVKRIDEIFSTPVDEGIHLPPASKRDVLSELESTIKHMKRQEDETWRARYFGEAMGIIQSLTMIGWLSGEENDAWRRRAREALGDSPVAPPAIRR